MGSKNKANLARILCATMAEKATDAFVTLRNDIESNLRSTPDFVLLNEQVKAAEIHYKTRDIAISMGQLVPEALEETDEVGSLAEIADAQLVDIEKCLTQMTELYSIVQPVWSEQAPKITAIESPSVESPPPLEDTDTEEPFDSAVEEASRQGVRS